MKRVDLDLTREQLVDLMRRDEIRRNIELIEMITLLYEIEGAYSIFLDGDWGAGKTVFVRQIQLLLEMMRVADVGTNDVTELIEVDEDLKPLLAASSREANQNTESDASKIIPIYFNAWENDYWDDPLPGLIQVIAWETGGNGKTVIKKPTEAIAATVDALVSLLGLEWPSVKTGDNISRAIGALRGQDLLGDYERRKKVRGKICELFSALDGARSDKYLLIIDELDRCKPTYALRLLEEIKTLFDLPSLIIIYSVNEEQLRKTVSGYYGYGFDAGRYLSRFYDMKYTLRTPNDNNYARSYGLLGVFSNNLVVTEMISNLNMSLREQNRYFTELQRINNLIRNDESSVAGDFAERTLAPILLALKVARPEDYSLITGHRDFELLVEHAFRVGKMRDRIEGAINAIMRLRNPAHEFAVSESDCKNFIIDMSVLIFSEDPSSSTYRDISDRWLDGAARVRGLRYISSQFVR